MMMMMMTINRNRNPLSSASAARQYVEENVNELSSAERSTAEEDDEASLIAQLLRSKISAEELVRIVTDLFLAAADTVSSRSKLNPIDGKITAFPQAIGSLLVTGACRPCAGLRRPGLGRRYKAGWPRFQLAGGSPGFPLQPSSTKGSFVTAMESAVRGSRRCHRERTRPEQGIGCGRPGRNE